MTNGGSSLLSLIDVVSCGLGAAVLLFLVYSALPHELANQPDGSRQYLGQSDTPRAPAGSVVKHPLRGRTVALRIVHVQERLPTTAVAEWKGAPKGCEAHRLQSPNETGYVLMCPAGVDPTVPLTLRVSGTTAGVGVRAVAADGEDVFNVPTRSESVVRCRTADLEVKFDLPKDPPIQVCGGGL